jgi:catechol 2,3-dioxygenase-like lactoylglutathione lyase family enzyme
MPERRIDRRVEIGAVRLRVADLDRMLTFYRDTLGFEITHRLGQTLAILSADGFHAHILLTADTARSGPLPSQFSIRYPDRAALADAYLWIARSSPVIDARDEGIRESLYLRDPGGNQIELYCERPRDQWPRGEDGTPRLASRPLDLESLRAAAPAADGSSAVPPSAPAPSLSERTRTRLSDIRLRLLNLHKVLIDDAKTAYEMDRGRIGSTANLLQLVINDPWFAWLHPLSELVVRIDETIQLDAPATEADGLVLLEQVERLLSPADASEDFAQRYYEALQRQPAVIVAHAEVRRILKQPK